MLNFAKYRYNPATVEACLVTEDNIVELTAIVGTTKLKIKPKVGEWVIKKESGMYEIWQNKAFEKKFSRLVVREIHPGVRAMNEALTAVVTKPAGIISDDVNPDA